MDDDLLIVEDLMLLLLAEDGTSVAGAAVLDYALAGAVLIELAHIERLEIHSHHRTKGTLIRAQRSSSSGQADSPEVTDPILTLALEAVGGKEYSARTLISALNSSLETGLKDLVLDRLAAREIVGRETKRYLGLIPTTRWPVRQHRFRARLGTRITEIVTGDDHVLSADGHPDAHASALIGLLSACQVYALLAPELPWNARVAKRIKAIEKGIAGPAGTASAVKEISRELAGAVALLTGATSSAPLL